MASWWRPECGSQEGAWRCCSHCSRCARQNIPWSSFRLFTFFIKMKILFGFLWLARTGTSVGKSGVMWSEFSKSGGDPYYKRLHILWSARSRYLTVSHFDWASSWLSSFTVMWFTILDSFFISRSLDMEKSVFFFEHALAPTLCNIRLTSTALRRPICHFICWIELLLPFHFLTETCWWGTVLPT